MTRRHVLAISIAALLSSSVAAMAADDYPNKPVKLILPAAAGGPTDVPARIASQILQPKLGQPVVIENRPGAAQNLGAELVYRAEPDGYTLLATPQGPLVISQSFFPKLGFDPKEFVPVTIMAKLPYILLVHPKLPVATFWEFIAYAQANPGKLNYGTPGLGSSSHLTGEMLKLAAGIEMTHVPYGGLAPGLTDLLAGHTT
jgi:tripartite-type tricarboxylate transporter receptor subunit TctC